MIWLVLPWEIYRVSQKKCNIIVSSQNLDKCVLHCHTVLCAKCGKFGQFLNICTSRAIISDIAIRSAKNCRANKPRIYICDDIATQIDICMVAAFCCSVSSVQSAAQCCSSGSVSCCSIVQRCSVAVPCSRAMCSGGAAGCSCSAVQRRVGPAGAAAAEVSRVTVGGETPAQTHPVGLTATATQRSWCQTQEALNWWPLDFSVTLATKPCTRTPVRRQEERHP